MVIACRVTPPPQTAYVMMRLPGARCGFPIRLGRREILEIDFAINCQERRGKSPLTDHQLVVARVVEGLAWDALARRANVSAERVRQRILTAMRKAYDAQTFSAEERGDCK